MNSENVTGTRSHGENVAGGDFGEAGRTGGIFHDPVCLQDIQSPSLSVIWRIYVLLLEIVHQFSYELII
jgi:hypothetical protein